MARIRHPQKVINEAVEKFLAGEQVRVLAKLYGVSRPCFYLWIKKYKAAVLANEGRVGMTPKALHDADMRELRVKVGMLTQDNARLKAKLFDCMLRHNDF